MFRNLYKITQSFMFYSSKWPKSVFLNTIRSNTNMANILRTQKAQKKDYSSETIKWVLLVRLYSFLFYMIRSKYLSYCGIYSHTSNMYLSSNWCQFHTMGSVAV